MGRRGIDVQRLRNFSEHPERLVGESAFKIISLIEADDPSEGPDYDESLPFLNVLFTGLERIAGVRGEEVGYIKTPLQAAYAARLLKAVASEVTSARANKKHLETSFSHERTLSAYHRVARYEGLTPIEIMAQLPEGVLAAMRDLFGFHLPAIAASGVFPNANHRIDPGPEAVAVASLFYGTINRYLRTPHQPDDFGTYNRERDLAALESQRGKILKSYEVDNLRHPAVEAMAAFPLRYIGSLQGGRVFYDVARTIEKYYPRLLKDRQLDALYPASGDHLAPLLTAFRLVDDGKIDRADFVFTEIKPEFRYRIEQQLIRLQGAGVIQNLAVLSPQLFSDGGDETLFSFKYKEKKITIRLALNRSGKSYWRSEDARQSELVIFHDVGTGEKRPLLWPLLEQRKEKGWKHPQVVLLEGREGESKELGDGLPRNFHEVGGQYGHCNIQVTIDTPSRELETGRCEYKSAVMFSLP